MTDLSPPLLEKSARVSPMPGLDMDDLDSLGASSQDAEARRRPSENEPIEVVMARVAGRTSIG